jgi:3-oxoacyl-[acyl-carrier protein] reductase
MEIRVLITGSNGQLGKAIVKTFKTNDNIRVIGIDITDEDKSSCDEYYKCDVTNEQEVEKIWGRISNVNCLINNVGKGVFSNTYERTKEEFMDVFETNVYSTFIMSIAAIKLIPPNQRLRIVNIASLYGNISSDYRIYGESKRNNSEIYTISKAGVIALTKYLATHYGSDSITINSVSPGGIKRSQSDDFIAKYSNKCPLGRLADANEIAEIVNWLSILAPSYLNGEDIIVDGGFSKW